VKSQGPGDGHTASLGERAWHVETIWKAAEGVAVESIAVDAIHEIDEDCWFNGRPATVRDVVRHALSIHNADLARPVILSSEGHVLDGMHRIAKALLEGRATISAQRLPTDPEPDWLTSEVGVRP